MDAKLKSNFMLFKRSVSSSLLVIIQSLIVNLAGIFYFFVAAHLLSIETVGILLFSSVLINLIITLFTFSFNFTSSRFYSLLQSKNSSVDGISSIVTLINLFSILVGIPVGFIISYLLMVHNLYVENLYLIALLIAIDGSVNSIIYNLYGLLIGKLKITKAIAGFSIANAIRYSLSVLIIILGGSLEQILLCWVLGDIAGVAYLYAYSNPSISFRSGLIFKDLRTVVKYTLPIYLSSILTYLYLYIDRYQVFFLSNIQSFAIYGTALTASMIFINIPQSISNALVAIFVKAYSSSYKELKELVKSVSKFLDIVMLPIIVVAAFLAQPIIELFAGSSYLSGWFTFFAVTLSFGLSLPIAVIYTYYLAVGDTKTIMISNIISIFISSILALLLYYNFNIFGITLGRSILFLLNFIILTIFIILKNKVDFGISFHFKYFFACMLFFSPLAIFAFDIIPLSKTLLLVFASSYLIVYFIIISFSNILDQEEVETFSSILPSFTLKFFRKLQSRRINNKIAKESLLRINNISNSSKVYSAFYNPDLIRIRFQ